MPSLEVALLQRVNDRLQSLRTLPDAFPTTENRSGMVPGASPTMENSSGMVPGASPTMENSSGMAPDAFPTVENRSGMGLASLPPIDCEQLTRFLLSEPPLQDKESFTV